MDRAQSLPSIAMQTMPSPRRLSTSPSIFPSPTSSTTNIQAQAHSSSAPTAVFSATPAALLPQALLPQSRPPQSPPPQSRPPQSPLPQWLSSQSHPSSTQNPQPSGLTAPRHNFKNCFTTKNILGYATLIATVTFGVGGWVVSKHQYEQGAKSLELTVWTACAEHENIQNTTLCTSVLSKSFDRFQLRSLDLSVTQIEDLVKREGEIRVEVNSDHAATPVETLIQVLSLTERRLIEAGGSYDAQIHPELRATIFPLAQLLYTPLRWFFSLVECLLLFILTGLHTTINCIAVATWFCFQRLLYSVAEGMIKSTLGVFDVYVLLKITPKRVPWRLVYGLPFAVATAILKSHWYGAGFWECVMWMFISRLGVYSVVSLEKSCWELYSRRRIRVRGLD